MKAPRLTRKGHGTGIDRILEHEFADLTDTRPSMRFGLVTNDRSLTADLKPGRAALMEAGVNLVRLFAPEHGITGAEPEGHRITSTTDPLTGLEVISMYGDQIEPEMVHLTDLDGILFDLADVGVRFYTYLWTLSHFMEACAKHGIRLYVLDRPNPLGGDLADVEGPLLDEAACSSFVGRWSIPIRHSLTYGELAKYWNHRRGINTDLHVVRMPRWDRAASYSDVGWIPPSPNIPSATTAHLYPGTCFAEGLNLAEGRSTPYPFRVVGAPWIDAHLLSEEFNKLDLPGIKSVPHSFTPHVRTWANVQCHGVYLTITDYSLFRPVRSGLKLFEMIAALWPKELEERSSLPMPGERHDITNLDKLLGVPSAFEKMKRGEVSNLSDFCTTQWTSDVEDYLLYYGN